QALDTIEMAFEGLSIEWFKVENHAPVVQKTIGSLHVRKTYNVTIIAILKKNMKKFFNPGPDSIIEAGDMLVLSGARHEVKRIINELLSSGGDS
ncbi:cation:proton antiporter regulatory subunit, partial [Bacillus sp. B-TM1]